MHFVVIFVRMLSQNARRDPEMLSVQDTAAEMLATEQLWHIVAFKPTYVKNDRII